MANPTTPQALLDDVLADAIAVDLPRYESANQLPMNELPMAVTRSLVTLKADGEDLDALLSHLVDVLPEDTGADTARSILKAVAALHAGIAAELVGLSVLVLRHLVAIDAPAGGPPPTAPAAKDPAARGREHHARQAMSYLLMATMEMHTSHGTADDAYCLADKALGAIGVLRVMGLGDGDVPVAAGRA